MGVQSLTWTAMVRLKQSKIALTKLTKSTEDHIEDEVMLLLKCPTENEKNKQSCTCMNQQLKLMSFIYIDMSNDAHSRL
jgi:hypothetical protein